MPTVEEEGGEPVILEEGRTREAYLDEQTGREAARQLALQHRELLDPAPVEVLPATFAPSTAPAPVLPVSQEGPADPTAGASPLPPYPPLRRVRELRLDLRTLDAAALFALETWRRAELGLEKLDMEVPQSIWYKPPTPPPEPVKRKPGRPRKSAPAASASRDASASMPLPPLSHSDRRTPSVNGETSRQGSLAAALQTLDALGAPLSDGPAAGPSNPPRSPSQDEIRPDAYNETEALDPSFIPDASPAPSSVTASTILGADGLPRPKRGRPSKADIEARTTYLPDGTAVIAPPPGSKRKKPRESAPAALQPLRIKEYKVPESDGTSTPSTDPAWTAPVSPAPSLTASGKRRGGPPKQSTGGPQPTPLDLPELIPPPQDATLHSMLPSSSEEEQLAPDGSLIPGTDITLPAAPPPPAPPSTSPQSAPKKRGRPPKVRPSLDPFGADLNASPSTAANLPMTATSAPLPPAVLQRVATLQEALAYSDPGSPLARLGAQNRDVANAAARIVSDISALPSPPPSPGSATGKAKGTRKMQMAVVIPSPHGDPDTPVKSKKRKSRDGEMPNPMAKRKNMTKEYMEYLDEWAFLKGL